MGQGHTEKDHTACVFSVWKLHFPYMYVVSSWPLCLVISYVTCFEQIWWNLQSMASETRSLKVWGGIPCSLSWLSYFGRGWLPCWRFSQDSLWRNARAKESRPLANNWWGAEASCHQPCEWTILEADPPRFSQTFKWPQFFHWNFMGDPEPDQLAKPL